MLLFDRLLRGWRRLDPADAPGLAASSTDGSMSNELALPDWETFGARVIRQSSQLDERIDQLRVQLQAYYRDEPTPTDLHGRTPFDRLTDLAGQLVDIRDQAGRAAPDYPASDRAQKGAHRLTLRLAEIAASLDRMQAVMERRRSRPGVPESHVRAAQASQGGKRLRTVRELSTMASDEDRRQ